MIRPSQDLDPTYIITNFTPPPTTHNEPVRLIPRIYFLKEGDQSKDIDQVVTNLLFHTMNFICLFIYNLHNQLRTTGIGRSVMTKAELLKNPEFFCPMY